jgi:ribosomal protein S18 acetylase RimI-like enzyme/SAM-dependent methyltransferase
MAELSVRRLSADQWATFAEIRLRALRESPDAFGATYEGSVDNDEAAWRGWLAGGAGWDGVVNSFVVDDDDGPFGIATCAVFDEAPGVAHLFSMWVDPACRRLGAGRLLVEAVVARARELGAQEVMLRVTEGNDAAAALYASCGFVGTADPPEPLREASALRTFAMRLLLLDVTDEELLAEQHRYYEDRAPVYEDVYFGRSRHDRGAVHDEGWFSETAQLEASIEATDASGDVLELACGTGLWTRFLAPRARRLVAVDASSAMLAQNRRQVGDQRVEYVQADVFDWNTNDLFDLIVMGFFVSHVPPSRFAAFWTKLAGWLRPGGVVWLTDDVAGTFRPATGAQALGGPSYAHKRQLGDADYTIVKRFFTPEELTAELEEVGWTADIRATGEHFFVGTARPDLG